MPNRARRGRSAAAQRPSERRAWRLAMRRGRRLGHQASLEFEADKGARSASSFTRGQNWIGIGPLEEQKPRNVGQWV